jgi:hypothetical protein
MTAESDFRRRAGGDHCRSRRWCWGALIAVQVRSHPWVVAADVRIMRHVTPSGERGRKGSERMVVCAAWSGRTARTGAFPLHVLEVHCSESAPEAPESVELQERLHNGRSRPQRGWERSRAGEWGRALLSPEKRLRRLGD